MMAADGKKARRDARELAATRPADPYRGALTDPYTGPVVKADPAPGQRAPASSGAPPSGPAPAAEAAEPMFGSVPEYGQLPAGNRAPTPAVMAGIISISLGAALGLFGLLLLAIISLQDEYGAPDRSFYRGSDSSYLLLALVDFALGACLAVGGIALLTGRLIGRLAITIAGWTVIALSGFWWLQAAVNGWVPLVLALSSLAMLALCYQASVTRWLGVLPAAQPE
ncbi:MAG: hypothetical protein ABIQ09_00150 [Jatrophihabitantaceae bacterium]